MSRTTKSNMLESEKSGMSAQPNLIKDLKPLELIYVQKWVDYSSKYGLGFILSD